MTYQWKAKDMVNAREDLYGVANIVIYHYNEWLLKFRGSHRIRVPEQKRDIVLLVNCSFYEFFGHPGMHHTWCIAITSECFQGRTPPQPLKNYFRLLGGLLSIKQRQRPGHKALCVALGGNFCRRWLWSTIVVMVIVDLCRQIIFIPMQHTYIFDSWPPETNVTNLAKTSCCPCVIAYAPPSTVATAVHF